MKLTAAEKNYILAIDRLSDGGRVSTNELAHEIGIAAASVTDMVQKLAEKEYVRYEKYKGVSLSPTAQRLARQLNSATNLWREFLEDRLELDEKEVENLLSQLQHVNSQNLTGQLKKYLDVRVRQPSYIPEKREEESFPTDLFSALAIEKKEEKPVKREEQFSNENSLSLADCRAGEMVYLTGLSPKFKVAVDLLAYLNLPLGMAIKVKTIHQFDGSLLVEVLDREILVTKQLAELILVSA